ncbi:MAG: DUF2905 domain-containing protein [Proteobacteria bacterium]|nr:MAG: DUF2905 domain-containing protein [Pseudomonadota bacterium]
MESLGRWLLVAGGVIVVVALAVLAAERAGLPLGRLPGDIRIEREGMRFYFPIVTCLVVSGALTLVLWLVSKLR